MEVLGNTKEIPEDHGRARPTYYVKLKELQFNFDSVIKQCPPATTPLNNATYCFFEQSFCIYMVVLPCEKTFLHTHACY